MTVGIIAVVIGYLLGAIPSAYIVTRVLTGRDIRRVSGGNVGARNVFLNIGRGPGAVIAILDIAKGAAAVAIANWVLAAPPYFVLAAGVAAVVGHIWSVFMKFKGGNGLATSLGVFAITLKFELLIALGITLLLIFFTHNLILAVNMSLLSMPVSVWFVEKWPLPLFIFIIVVMLIMVLHMIPGIREQFERAKTKNELAADLLRHKKA